MRRKFWIALLSGTLLALLLCGSAIAVVNKVDAPTGGEDFNHASEINEGTYLYLEGVFQRVPSPGSYGYYNAWYKFIAQESGEYYFYGKAIKTNGNGLSLRIYDKYEEKIAGTDGRIGDYDTALYSANLSKGQLYYVNYTVSVGVMDNKDLKAFLAICSPSQHVLVGDRQIVDPPTCTESGYSACVCEACNTKLDREEIPATGHSSGEWITSIPSTCTETGSADLHCKICNTILDSKVLPATGHSSGSWIVIQKASCTTQGKEVQYCTTCNSEINSKVLEPLGHVNGEWQTTHEPTCTSLGLKQITCNVCGVILSSEYIPALGHEYTEWEIVKEATKQEEGEQQRHCIRCGDTQSEVIPKKPKFLGLF